MANYCKKCGEKSDHRHSYQVAPGFIVYNPPPLFIYKAPFEVPAIASECFSQITHIPAGYSYADRARAILAMHLIQTSCELMSHDPDFVSDRPVGGADLFTVLFTANNVASPMELAAKHTYDLAVSFEHPPNHADMHVFFAGMATLAKLAKQKFRLDCEPYSLDLFGESTKS